MDTILSYKNIGTETGTDDKLNEVKETLSHK